MTLSETNHGDLRHAAWAIFAMAVGIFAIGTGEFAAMGVLPEIASDMHVNIQSAGNVISSYAIGVMVGAPSIAVVAAKMSRQRLLIWLMAWFAATNILETFSPTITTLNIARFISGLPHGAFMGVASLVAADLVDKSYRGRAVGYTFAGMTIANVVGAPFSTYVGSYMGWRPAYMFIGGVGILCCLLLMRCVPHDQPHPERSPLSELGAFAHKKVWFIMAIAVFGCGGMFCVYTYFAETLKDVTHIPKWGIPLFQALWGVGMCVGTWISGKMMDKNLYWTTVGAFVWSIASLALFSYVAPSFWLTFIDVFLLGGCIVLGPIMQVRLMDTAHNAQTLAAALNHAAFNLANAMGAWLGGFVLTDGYGLRMTGVAGAGLSVVGLILFLLASLVEHIENR